MSKFVENVQIFSVAGEKSPKYLLIHLQVYSSIYKNLINNNKFSKTPKNRKSLTTKVWSTNFWVSFLKNLLTIIQAFCLILFANGAGLHWLASESSTLSTQSRPELGRHSSIITRRHTSSYLLWNYRHSPVLQTSQENGAFLQKSLYKWWRNFRYEIDREFTA